MEGGLVNVVLEKMELENEQSPAGRALQCAREHRGWDPGTGEQAIKIDKGERRGWKRSVCLFL